MLFLHKKNDSFCFSYELELNVDKVFHYTSVKIYRHLACEEGRENVSISLISVGANLKKQNKVRPSCFPRCCFSTW